MPDQAMPSQLMVLCTGYRKTPTMIKIVDGNPYQLSQQTTE